MPYISDVENRRKELRDGAVPETAGELNYKIFVHAKYNDVNVQYVKTCVEEFLGTDANYQKYNDMAGCLLLCANEIKRRLNKDIDFLFDILENYFPEIDSYEDKKIISNGDV